MGRWPVWTTTKHQGKVGGCPDVLFFILQKEKAKCQLLQNTKGRSGVPWLSDYYCTKEKAKCQLLQNTRGRLGGALMFCFCIAEGKGEVPTVTKHKGKVGGCPNVLFFIPQKKRRSANNYKTPREGGGVPWCSVFLLHKWKGEVPTTTKQEGKVGCPDVPFVPHRRKRRSANQSKTLWEGPSCLVRLPWEEEVTPCS